MARVQRIDLLSAERIRNEIQSVKPAEHWVEHFLEQADYRAIKILDLDATLALRIRHALATVGGIGIVSEGCESLSDEMTDLLVVGTVSQIRRLPDELDMEDEETADLVEAIVRCARETDPSTFLWRCREKTFLLGRKTLVMGIVNVTPDSFSDGGRFLEPDDAVEHAMALAEAGADILDIGGESTRPGSTPVPVREEIGRVIPVVERIRDSTTLPISIDTTKSEVVRAALDSGVEIVNDVSALRSEPRMAEMVAQAGAGIILMHMQGLPRTMQDNPSYDNVVVEVADFLDERIEIALEAGIEEDQIVVDPGIGFGKTTADNLKLLAHIGALAALGRPVMVGVSRKRFIGELLNLPCEDRLEGTAGAVASAVWQGAQIVRVHDVAEIVRVVKIIDAIRAHI